MKRRTLISLAAATPLAGAQEQPQKPRNWRTAPQGYSDTPALRGQPWKVHDITRPHPPIVVPAQRVVEPPSDAIVLFNGKDLSQWFHWGKPTDKARQVPPRWKVENGYVECVGKTGDLITRERFGDAQFHIEWSAPAEIDGDSQWRGNSGIVLMGRYEIQILDSWDNPTFADGQAGAIFGQWPPLANPCRRPGEWNNFDIMWEAPRFDNGKLAKPAYLTLLFNGVLVHHHRELSGPTRTKQVLPYEPHSPEEPLSLQDHDTRIRFRNIWARRLRPYDSR